MKKITSQIIAGLLLIVFLGLPQKTISQEIETPNQKLDVSGLISVTNKGISIVPALSLGKPASLFNLSVGKRFRFEPEFRFSLDGEPWSFIFWFRYDIVNNDRFSLRLGGHPAFSFRTVPARIDGANQSEEIIETRRFLAGDVNANYSLKDQTDIGLYYLGGHGFESSVPDQTHYLSLYTSLSNITLFSDLYLNFRPQVYYLKIDELDGFYTSANIALGVSEIPVTISSTINKIIDSEITGNDDPLWNVSLNYSFRF